MQIDYGETKQVEHKVNCAAWGCKCQEKNQKKPDLPKRPERHYLKEVFPLDPRHSKIKNMYPQLYRWD